MPQNRRRNRPPLPHEQRQHGARDQHVQAPLQLLRHGAGPCAFEPGPRHHGMLQAEERDQADIHQDRESRRTHVAPKIDGSRHQRPDHREGIGQRRCLQIAEEGEQVQEHQQERAIADDAEQERGGAVDSGRHVQCSWPSNCSQDTSECQFTNAPVGFGFHAQTCSV